MAEFKESASPRTRRATLADVYCSSDKNPEPKKLQLDITPSLTWSPSVKSPQEQKGHLGFWLNEIKVAQARVSQNKSSTQRTQMKSHHFKQTMSKPVTVKWVTSQVSFKILIFLISFCKYSYYIIWLTLSSMYKAYKSYCIQQNCQCHLILQLGHN